jgi:hypothetical protein
LAKFDESFEVKAAKLWNVLPSRLSHISSLNLFKTELDNFLTKIPDEPPLPGYPYKCNNSIINHISALE